MVFLHAFPLGAEQWLPQLARVAPGWRFIAPDLRGFGGSSGVAEGGMTMESYADDVLTLMAHLDVPEAVVTGLSMGGYVALAMVKKAPKRVSGLVLADTRPGADSVEARAGRDRMLTVLAERGVAGVADELLPKILGATTRREQPDLVDAVRRLMVSNHPDGVGAAIEAMKERPDSTPVLSTIGCPTVLIVGVEDVVTPVAESEAMHQAIPGSRLVVLPHAGHLSNLENAAEFTVEITSGVFSRRR